MKKLLILLILILSITSFAEINRTNTVGVDIGLGMGVTALKSDYSGDEDEETNAVFDFKVGFYTHDTYIYFNEKAFSLDDDTLDFIGFGISKDTGVSPDAPLYISYGAGINNNENEAVFIGLGKRLSRFFYIEANVMYRNADAGLAEDSYDNLSGIINFGLSL